jgi:nitrite reductase/ring-hydroxylating ferredoxin subunit/uncharacterized membrane protein
MALQEAVNETISQQKWLEPASEGVQQVVTGALQPYTPAARPLNDFLNGVWLGHPLHSVLTDIPVGAWTTAALFDVVELATGRAELAPAADGAVGIGILGAFGSAVTGLADWQYTVGLPRRTGLIHATLNVAAVGFYAASWLLRRAGRRRAGHVTAFLGYGVVAVSAYLGGELVYRDRLGTDHTPEETPPTAWTPVLAEAELAEGSMKSVRAGNVQVMLARQNGAVYALAEQCAHLGGPLSEGTLERESVICPWHGSRFKLADGSLVHGPSCYAQPAYETRVRNGQIELRQPPSAGGR